MSLSIKQQLLLEGCSLDLEMQQFLARELGDQGEPLEANAPDFLKILCNVLQITEKRLQYLRYQFAKKVDINGQQTMMAEPPPDVAILEEEIKNIWLLAAALWRATDQVVRYPEDFNVKLSLQHIEYALLRNNLPVIEMIKWARPDFFSLSPLPKWYRFIVGTFAALISALTGFWGGFLGAIKQCQENKNNKKGFFKFVHYPFSVLIGMFSGSAMGFMTAYLFGLQTGHFTKACKLGYKASYLNPFHEPRGTKYQQAVELQREESLFELSQPLTHYNGTHIFGQSRFKN